MPSIDYTPRSPEASAFSRYGDIPVDLSTGVPKIEIPLYSIHLGDVEIPITLSYHASGIKMNDLPSEVGLGWVLNIGGNITAQRLDHADYESLVNPTYKTSEDAYALILRGSDPANYPLGYEVGKAFWIDMTQRGETEPGLNDGTSNFFSDRYQYSLGTGESGVFRQDFVNGAIHFLPYSANKVTKLQGDSICMRTAKGCEYKFHSANTIFDLYLPSEIISSRAQKAKYYYTLYNYNNVDGIVSSLSWFSSYYQMVQGFFGPLDAPGYTISHQSITQGTIVQLPDSIVTDKEVVVFSYLKDRLDNSNYRLREIVIKDRLMNHQIKRFVLEHSYFSSNDRLRLDEVHEYSRSEVKPQTYSFEYNRRALPAYPSAANGYTMYNDYWGYNNNKSKTSQIPNLVLSYDIHNKDLLNSQVGDFTPDGDAAKACILEKIVYPTGGRTEFVFKAHSDTILAGGVRVDQIRNYDGISASPIVKKYNYSNPHYEPVDVQDFVSNTPTEVYAYYDYKANAVRYTDYNITSSSFSSMSTLEGPNVIYGTVEEIILDDVAANGKTVYNFENSDNRYYAYANPLILDYAIGLRYSYLCDYGNFQPKLLSKSIYAKRSNSFQLVQKETYNYTNYKSIAFPVGLAVASNVRYIAPYGVPNGRDVFDLHNGYGPYLRDYYSQTLRFCNAIGHEDNTLLSSKSVIDYPSDGNQPVESVESYQYDDRLQVSETTRAVNNKDILKTVYKYPYDSEFSSTAPYDKMIALNKISPVIEEIKYKNQNILTTTKTTYKNWSNSIIEPFQVSVKHADSTTFDLRLSYLNYNENGDVIAVSKSGSPVISYVYGKKNPFPIAKVLNAGPQEVAVGDFEVVSDYVPSLNPNYNWYLPNTDYPSSLSHFSSDSKTGRQSCRAPVINSKMLPLGNYQISFFAKGSGSLAINGVTVNLSPTWEYYSLRLAGIQSVILNNGSSSLVDNLCIYPEFSSINTYTYDPLVGMTSSTDSGGRITYYQYDGFNRLQSIQDGDNKILKSIRYHYK